MPETANPTTSASGSDVRVRFCPSPTGTPHVGLVRTALFNWAYARHTGGTFVFRIEDTDAARDSEESYEQIIDALTWLGLDWDEGIGVGGPHEPYRQSQRGEIYAEIIEKLKAAGHLYESYSTAEEIDARNEAAGRPKQFGYDNFDRDLTDEQRAAFRAEGREPALRMRVPDVELAFDDLVRGRIDFPAGSTTDFVAVRPNGVPLYTFVNPVDDAIMGITHVLRGEDLLSSTPRQIALYHALIDIGLTTFIPRFGHLPYVMGEGNKKLSKRDPESNLFHHRDRGFIPEGLVNYLALLGWGFSADRDVFSREELIAAFDVVDVNPNPARFDLKKAEAINGDHIRQLDDRRLRGPHGALPPGDRCDRDADHPRAGGRARRGRPTRAGAHRPARRGARHARVPLHGCRGRRVRGECARRPPRRRAARAHRGARGPRPPARRGVEPHRDRGGPARRPHRRARPEAARGVRPRAHGDLWSPGVAAALRVDADPGQDRLPRPHRSPHRAARIASRPTTRAEAKSVLSGCGA